MDIRRRRFLSIHRFAHSPFLRVFVLLFPVCLLLPAAVFAEDLKLQDLIDGALKNNHDLIVSGLKISTSEYRIPQAKSLPDPMFMVGYQNEGWSRYTYGEMQGSQWMFSASQMFPFPGKLALKEEVAVRDSESFKAMYDSARLQVIAKVKILYYDLFLTYKGIDLVKDKTALFSKVEDAALARYSSGIGQQEEVLMAQAEKYMLMEKEEMLRQRLQSIEAMLNEAIGKEVNSPLGRPVEPVYSSYKYTLDELLRSAYENSPEIKAKGKITEAAEARVKMAEKEYYPDFTLGANVAKRSGQFEDMWSLTTAINIPIFYRTKQKMAVLEAESAGTEARHELEATKLMLASKIKDDYSMLTTSGKLMELYRDGLIPKTYQDFDSALAGYTAGKIEAITVISRLKSLIDYDLLYWGQFVEREKAIARLEALTAINSFEPAIGSQGEK